MKSIALFLPAALFAIASCTGEVTTEEGILNDLVDEVEAEMNNDEKEDETNSSEASGGTQAWDEFVAKYDEGYDMFDGNKSLDGTEVSISGVVEKVVDYEDIDGNEFAQAHFGVEDGTFGKSKLIATFDPAKAEVLRAAKKDASSITFTGKVTKKEFGEINIESCELISE